MGNRLVPQQPTAAAQLAPGINTIEGRTADGLPTVHQPPTAGFHHETVTPLAAAGPSREQRGEGVTTGALPRGQNYPVVGSSLGVLTEARLPGEAEDMDFAQDRTMFSSARHSQHRLQNLGDETTFLSTGLRVRPAATSTPYGQRDTVDGASTVYLRHPHRLEPSQETGRLCRT